MYVYMYVMYECDLLNRSYVGIYVPVAERGWSFDLDAGTADNEDVLPFLYDAEDGNLPTAVSSNLPSLEPDGFVAKESLPCKLRELGTVLSSYVCICINVSVFVSSYVPVGRDALVRVGGLLAARMLAPVGPVNIQYQVGCKNK
jgi:hypothetical protein